MTTTTMTMQAIVQHGYGAPEQVLRLEDVARPEPAEGQVLVRVRATSVNTPDWLATLGQPWVLRATAGVRRPRTVVRGTDLAGVVAQVGPGVTDLAPGDEVVGSTWADSLHSPGTFAEYALAPATGLVRRPAALGWAESAAAVMSGITALVGVRDVAPVRPGMRVLVNGASGGVGTFLVQLAHALGAEVTGVCSGRNVDLVRSLGATHVVDYTQQDLGSLDRRFDVVFDNVMNHPWRTWAQLLTDEGVLVPNSVGQGTALLAGLPRIAWTSMRGAVGSLSVGTITCVIDRRNLSELVDLLTTGEVRTVLDGTYDLADAGLAVARMASHRARGNIAITVP